MKRQFSPLSLFLTGAFLSQLGNWLQIVAQGWLVVALSPSPLWSGFICFCGGIPFLIFPFITGSLTDQWDRRKILLGTQWVLCLMTGGFAWLVLSQSVTLWSVAGFAFLTGTATALSFPA